MAPEQIHPRDESREQSALARENRVPPDFSALIRERRFSQKASTLTLD
ncbi:MAG TPA: hypothetical protein PKY49_03685 [Anaerolineae bacterium]|nr:hypothetical protein [Anaerolineae bacterium]